MRDWPRAGGEPVRSWLSLAPALGGIALLAATWAGAAPAEALAPSVVKPTQELVSLFSPHKAFSSPTAGSRVVARLQTRRPITEQRTVLPVLAHKTGSGHRWLLVRLPGRPNGRTGWIMRRATVSWKTGWHVVVITSSRRVVVYDHSRRIRIFKAVVGKPTTPTPLGEFFVEESIKLSPGAVGAPFALALSARSTVYQEFAGGPGQIALHGLNNIGGTPGTAVSHGCVRLDTGATRWLVRRIGPGVPVTITR
ncbi:MAG: L,D-transpeptidase [Actinomycetota bacterium]